MPHDLFIIVTLQQPTNSTLSFTQHAWDTMLF